MTTSFPGALDAPLNPSSSTLENASGYEHDLQHSNANDAYVALEKVAKNVVNVKTFQAAGAKGDGATDDTTAINAAITALGSIGGTVYFPASTGKYKCTGTLNVGNTDAVVFEGPGATTGGVSPGAILSYTGTGVRFIDARSTRGFTMKGMNAEYTNSSFTGNLVDLTHGASATDSTFWVLDHCLLNGTQAAGQTAALINCDKSINGLVNGGNYVGGGYGIKGKASSGSYANSITITDRARFNAQAVAPIYNAGQAWDICATFEGNVDGSACAYAHDSGGSVTANGTTFRDCWMGDSDGVPTGSWITWAGNELNVIGGYIGLANGDTGVTISLSSCHGIKIETEFAGGGASSKGVDFGSTTSHRRVWIDSEVGSSIGTPVAGTLPSTDYTRISNGLIRTKAIIQQDTDPLRPTAYTWANIRRDQRFENATVLTSTDETGWLVQLPEGLVISSVFFHTGTVAFSGSVLNQWFVVRDSNRTKLAITGDDTTTAWGASAAKGLFLARTVTDAAISSGTATLTSATAAFTSADTGQKVTVLGAGAAGAPLGTSAVPVTMTYVNATTVTLSTNASTTVASAGTAYIGTPYTVPSNGAYYIGAMVKATVGNFTCTIHNNSTVVAGLAPVISYQDTTNTGLTTPATAITTAAATSTGFAMPYIGIA